MSTWKKGLRFVHHHYIHSSFFLAQPLFAYALCLVPAMPPMHYQSICMSITRGSSLDGLCCYRILWCQSSYIEQVYDSLTWSRHLHIGLSMPLSHRIFTLCTHHRVMASWPLYKSIHDDRDASFFLTCYIWSRNWWPEARDPFTLWSLTIDVLSCDLNI